MTLGGLPPGWDVRPRGWVDRRLVAGFYYTRQGCRTSAREGFRRKPSLEPIWPGTRTYATPPVLNDMGDDP